MTVKTEKVGFRLAARFRGSPLFQTKNFCVKPLIHDWDYTLKWTVFRDSSLNHIFASNSRWHQISTPTITLLCRVVRTVLSIFGIDVSLGSQAALSETRKVSTYDQSRDSVLRLSHFWIKRKTQKQSPISCCIVLRQWSIEPMRFSDESWEQVMCSQWF